ncbi:hypothetical protein D3C71_89490 [compost metagenome]
MIILLCISASVLACCIHLKLEEQGRTVHENKGVFPEVPLWDVSNFATPLEKNMLQKMYNKDTLCIDYCNKK